VVHQRDSRRSAPLLSGPAVVIAEDRFDVFDGARLTSTLATIQSCGLAGPDPARDERSVAEALVGSRRV
jgi:hypothetical protein